MVLNEFKTKTILVAGKRLHKKMSSSLRHLPLNQRILYYNAMIKQTMMYGSSVWVLHPLII
ncbi:unnamed protein product [Porites lobata]|uniref:Uncharacterized protein n=1 Tax=Porites lobata TaxID=104759 RepID=A0ABN8N9I7_9CNID|nr:unnamed protein product [Porites lobata]